VSEAVGISPAQCTGGEIRIVRVFGAPRRRVFEAWTETRHLARWFGPRGFTAPVVEADVREGGSWRACIRSPEGVDYRMRGIYREIVPLQRLVFTHLWEEGHSAAGHETLVTITFEDAAHGTRMEFRKAVLVSVAEHFAQHAGWSEALDRLGEYLIG